MYYATSFNKKPTILLENEKSLSNFNIQHPANKNLALEVLKLFYYRPGQSAVNNEKRAVKTKSENSRSHGNLAQTGCALTIAIFGSEHECG